ncbi:MAG: DJ-1/PfpI family protein [Zetaproteobacteria bacterium]|nr:MAG: DJ-1/PfpI family protein [Zetaproteobacteria bacterium]
MSHRVLVPFTEGFEEIECLSVVDVLRRAGVSVTLASLDGRSVTGRSQVTVEADAALDDLLEEEWSMVVLPGGLPNAFILRDDARVRDLVRRTSAAGREVAAICAAPLALAAYGVVGDRRVTSYPGTGDALREAAPDAVYCDDAVVEDRHLITSRGPGTALAFALRLVARLCGEEKAREVREELVAG